MEFSKLGLVKSPFNYTGGKYKLLPQILPYFPDGIGTFVDLFCGGCNVGINVNAEEIICNDNLVELIDLLNWFKQHDVYFIKDQVIDLVHSYGLLDTDHKTEFECQKAYLILREAYNKSDKKTFESAIMFYALICCAFSNNIRFNKLGEFTEPYGRRTFNTAMQDNLLGFLYRLQDLNISFVSGDFKEFSIDSLNRSDFVYCDPPYLVSDAAYNVDSIWNETLEKELLEYLDLLNEEGIRFALSNVLEDKGRENKLLKEWAKKYIVLPLDIDYSNCNYHKKNRSKNVTEEVLIVNYELED